MLGKILKPIFSIEPLIPDLVNRWKHVNERNEANFFLNIFNSNVAEKNISRRSSLNFQENFMIEIA